MKSSPLSRTAIFGAKPRSKPGAIAVGILLIGLAALPAQAQTFSVIHTFTGSDGGNPYAGLTIDGAGNFYGTTEYGGAYPCGQGLNCGTVFKLTHRGSGWVTSQLYQFTGGNDGGLPQARVVFGPDGTLYGTTGDLTSNNRGTVFNLRPPAAVCKSVSCPWTESPLFTFDFATGYYLEGDLAFDASANIYGTTVFGGIFENCGGQGCGVVYELTPSGGSWTENILYNFTDGSDGGHPSGGVILDHAGNLYGTAELDNYGGSASGLVFEFSPSGSSWTEKALYHFVGTDDGEYPYAGLIFDRAGNLYGATVNGGTGGSGAVFRLTPSGGQWNFALLDSLAPGHGGLGPYQSLVMDSAGNLYGSSWTDGAHGHGSVFKLTPSNGGWTYTDLYDFSGNTDGDLPNGNLVLDASGNIYGTTYQGGRDGTGCFVTCGVIFEITP
jgi:uncharacterized repeat protein (TIGR03803 family)